MLNVYCGRENIDKQKFMFESISKDNRYPIYLVVPDQSTLEAERTAFDYLKVPAYINPIVTSMSRLADRIASEVGGSTEHIDKYGKYMLFARILYRGKDSYEIFKNYENSSAFIEKLSDAIVSLKSHMVTPEDLAECLSNMEADSILKRKCSDILAVYEKYEEQIAASIPDNIDILKMMAGKIKDSKQIKKSAIWISGFDFLSPVDMDIIINLAANAEEVNLLLTAERGNSFFALTNNLAEKLVMTARDEGIEAGVFDVPPGYEYPEIDKKPDDIKHIEKALFSYPIKKYAYGESPSPNIKFVMASNFHSEAEAAASEICKLIREEGLKYKDILVLCNDVDKRASAIKRVFEEYNLATFMDRRRDVDHNPVLEFILALPEIISGGKKREDIFRWIKTGLTGIDINDAEELENYATVYNLRGRRWGEELTLGADKYDPEVFDVIKTTASKVNNIIEEFESLFTKGKTGRERTDGLHTFLTQVCDFPNAIEAYADRLEEKGFIEYSDELRNIWDVIEKIFVQINALMGNLTMSIGEYATVLKVGFESIKMGVLPHTADSVLIGTMQRTRTNHIRALFVLGANDGELPIFGTDDGLISDEEKDDLEQRGILVGRRNDNLLNEEELAIYKNLSKPSRMLYMSYTAATPDGKESKSSMIFERMRKIFPDIPLEKDTDVIDYFYSEKSTFARLSSKIREKCVNGNTADIWDDIWLWYEKNEKEKMDLLLKGLSFTNRREVVDRSNMAKLLGGEYENINISPSAIERYSRCQFAFFMDRGLHLKELREFAIDSRNMGNIYHEVLDEFGSTMSLDKLPVNDEKSNWNTIDKEKTNELIEKIFAEVSENYESGILEMGNAERYRRDRLKCITRDVAWALVEKVRVSQMREMQFETGFGPGRHLGPIEINISDCRVSISGRIDRLDIIEGDYAKVLDYKSGSDKFDLNDVLNGWQMQLMIYLKAASSKYKPAGASYFKIFEPHINLDTLKGGHDEASIKEALSDNYSSDGIIVTEVFNAEKNDGEKEIVKEDFDNLLNVTDEILRDLASNLTEGNVFANPKTKGKKNTATEVSACRYCRYRSICNYDEMFS